MAFEIARFSSDGLNLLSELTTSKSIKLKNVYVDTVVHSLEDVEEPVSWWATETAEAMRRISASISSAGKVNDKEARLTIQMKLIDGDETQQAKTVVVTACGVESGIEGPEIVLCAVSDTNGVEILYNDSGIAVSTSIAIYFAFSNASSITVEGTSNPDYVIHSELDRFVSAHTLGAPERGDNQTIRGSKFFKNTVVLDVGETWEDYLKSGVVITKYADNPDDESLYQGRITSNHMGLAIDGLNVDNYNDFIVFRDCLGEYEYKTIMCLTKLEGDYEVSITNATFRTESLVAGRAGVTISKNLIPDGSNIGLGDSDNYFSGVYTSHIDFGTGYIGSGGSGLIEMQGNLIPAAGPLRFDLGSNSNRWRQIYTDNLRCTSSMTLMANNNTRQIVMNASSGNITIEGFNTGYGLVLEPIQDPETFTYYSRTPITCGKLHGELVSPEYVPTADHPAFPGEDEYTEPPLFGVEVGSVIMAIPCWATLRDTFGNPQPAGKIIDVVTPSNWETAQPFTHTNDYANDPEKGAWYYATFKPGSGAANQSTYVPLRTATQGSSGGVANYAYLHAGKYKLLSCVSAYNSSYSDYVPNGYTGACVMLQRIS